ncbi:MAG TPA: S9 family peptidase [Holophagaceae bacterium]|nr:S9 family peptidase [Holophagaceae bacterium]
MRRILPIAAILLASPLAASRPMTIDDMFKVARVAAPAVSVTGDIAYQVGMVDLAANKVHTQIWIRHYNSFIDRPDALEVGSGNQSSPRFSPDGKSLSYEQGGQLWIVDLSTMKARQLTKLEGGASTARWSPDGKWIAFLSTTVPSGDATENAAYLKAQSEKKSDGRLIKNLMFRHWTEWKDPMQRTHLFVVSVDGSTAPKDVTAGLPYDVPTPFDFASGDDFDWSPDSKKLAFAANPEQDTATSTNGDIFEVAVDSGKSVNLSKFNLAQDSTPRYTPDGKSLVWRAQRDPGHESDKFELWLYDRAAKKVVATTQKADISVNEFHFRAGRVLFTADQAAQEELFSWDPATGAVAQLTHGLAIGAFEPAPDGSIVAQISSTATPPDVYRLDPTTWTSTRLSHHNEALAKELGLNRAESFWFQGDAGPDVAPGRTQVRPPQIQMLVVKPVNYDPAKKYPMAFLIHGGPQGQWADSWSNRWNPEVWANAGEGFITVMVNPRGSTGRGQAFCDEISGDWNGRVMGDLMLGLDAALAKVPNADPKRVAAAGASYGGYAINWIAGHYADRFACFICHDGVYNLDSMTTTTEELWFPKWENKGWPWQDRAVYDTASPHLFAKNFKKPMLVVQGEQDFRVPIEEGLQNFQTHQLMGIPSELLYFPDEGHWVLKPANSKLWHETVLGWMEQWTK